MTPEEQRAYAKGYQAGRKFAPKPIVQTRFKDRTMYAYLPDPAMRSPQNRICAAALDVDQALLFWRLFTTRLAKDTVRLIPHSRAAWRFYRAAKREGVELCNYIKPGASLEPLLNAAIPPLQECGK